MKRNRILYLSFILLSPVLFSVIGCKKFLDRKPLSATDASVLQADAFTMYNTFQGYAGFATLPWLDFNSIRDDDTKKGSSTTDGAEINAEFETFQYTKDDWATDTYWGDHYTLIGQANKLLYDAKTQNLKDPASLQEIGEACFFRAYSYFELVKAYGEVPIINYYYTNASQGIQPKSPVTAVYALIDSDLNVASQNLPINWVTPTSGGASTFPGRVTKGSANTLWAQTNLFRQNWSMVAALCREVIASGQYSLVPNYKDIWVDGVNGVGKNSSESILEQQNYVGPNGSPDNGSNWGVSQNVRQGGASSAWNLGWGWNVPTQTCVNAWDSTDPRKAISILYSGKYDGGPATGGYGFTLPPYSPGSGLDQPFWNKKVYIANDPAMQLWTGRVNAGNPDWINHRVLRYADVLLMLAEASNEMGDTATAAASLELVRVRASGQAPDPNHTRTILPYIPFTTQAAMRTAIKNERRWEFAFEGYRFYDLVRWGDALSVLGPLGYTARCQYYPIPQPDINASGGVLTQNPLWP